MKKLITEQEFTKEISRLRKLAGINQIGSYEERRNVKNMYQSYLVESQVIDPIMKKEFPSALKMLEEAFIKHVSYSDAFSIEEKEAVRVYTDNYGYVITEQKVNHFYSQKHLINEGLLSWFGKFWEKLKNFGKNIKDFIMKVWESMKNFIVGKVEGIKDFAKNKLKEATGAIIKFLKKSKAAKKGKSEKSDDTKKNIKENEGGEEGKGGKDPGDYPFEDFKTEVTNFLDCAKHIGKVATGGFKSLTDKVANGAKEEAPKVADEELKKAEAEAKNKGGAEGGEDNKVSESLRLEKQLKNARFSSTFVNYLMLENRRFRALMEKKKGKLYEDEEAEIPTDITKPETHSKWKKIGHIIHIVLSVMSWVLNPLVAAINWAIKQMSKHIYAVVGKISQWLKGPAPVKYLALAALTASVLELFHAWEAIFETMEKIAETIAAFFKFLGGALDWLTSLVWLIGVAFQGMAIVETFMAVLVGVEDDTDPVMGKIDKDKDGNLVWIGGDGKEVTRKDFMERRKFRQ
jgi:hypothetical protein